MCSTKNSLGKIHKELSKVIFGYSSTGKILFGVGKAVQTSDWMVLYPTHLTDAL